MRTDHYGQLKQAAILYPTMIIAYAGWMMYVLLVWCVAPPTFWKDFVGGGSGVTLIFAAATFFLHQRIDDDNGGLIVLDPGLSSRRVKVVLLVLYLASLFAAFACAQDMEQGRSATEGPAMEHLRHEDARKSVEEE